MRGGDRLTVAIHFDLICPWCFIGKRHLERARERFAQAHSDIAVHSIWLPVRLLPNVPETGLPFGPFYVRRLGSPEAVRNRQTQVVAAARNAGLELALERIERLPNTARAHQLLLRAAMLGNPALYESMLDRLFSAYFQRGEDIGDAATLQALAAEVGVPDDAPVVAAGDARRVPDEPPAVGVPHFVFDGQLSLSGAYDADMLFDAMSQVARKSGRDLAPA